MNQYSPPGRQNRSSSGCGRVAMMGGGCVLVVIFGFVVVIIAGALLWDRGSEAGGNFASSWLTDRFGTDISDRADAIDDVGLDLPEARDFDNQDDYLAFLDSYHREFARAMDEAAQLFSSPQMQDDNWVDRVARQLAIIRLLESEAQSVTPPPEFESAHGHWVDGMSEYRSAMDSAASAVDNVSPSQLMESIQSLNSATRSYISMGRTLDEMGVLEDLEMIERLREIDEQP